MKKFKGNQAGFTLIELIVVMIIIGILVLLATPRFIKYVKDANATSLQVDAKTVHDADLYQNLKAYDEAGMTKDNSRGKGHKMKDIIGEPNELKGYNHKIFTEGFDNGATGNKPDFNNSKEYDFDNWLIAMAGSYERATGEKITKVVGGEIKLDETADNYDKFMAIEYAAISDKVLARHIRNTRYGVNNFIVAVTGINEGEAYYMGYVEDGDNVMHVSLLPSGVEKVK